LSKDVFPSILGALKLDTSLGWLGWIAALVLWMGFGWFTGFTLGHWMLAFLLVIHAMVGYVELGTDNWIQDITKIVVTDKNPTAIDKNSSLIALAWTNILMFGLRFFAGPIVHRISPIGLLFVSAVIGTAGLVFLGLPVTKTAWLWLGAVTVYGIGK